MIKFGMYSHQNIFKLPTNKQTPVTVHRNATDIFSTSFSGIAKPKKISPTTMKITEINLAIF
jgi:hypothetical protein